MNRRDFLTLLGVGSTAALLQGCDAFKGKPEERPNIVLVIADDPGYNDFGYRAEGKICRTPNIDTLSEGGTRFTNAYATCSVCSPSRAGIMTGRYQNRFGYEYNSGYASWAADSFGLPTNEVTIAEVAKEAGYATGYIGKWHLGYRREHHPLERGFDEFFGFLGGAQDYYDRQKDPWDPILRGHEPVDEKEYLTHAFTREAVSFIDRHASEKPFFLMVSYNAVHFPWQAPEEEINAFPEIPEGKRRIVAGMVKVLDDGVGEILKKLREKKQLNNTVFIFTGDNGGGLNMDNSPLSGFKGPLLEGGIRVPFVIQWPGHFPAGKRYDGLTSTLDIFPTVAAAARAVVPTDREMDGVNLEPYARGKLSGPPHTALYWRRGYFGEAIRNGSWKLIRLNDGSGTPKMMFNLADDVGEKNNLYPTSPAADEKPKADIDDHETRMLERANALEADLDTWSSQMMEPLWSNNSDLERVERKKAGLPIKRVGRDLDMRLDTQVDLSKYDLRKRYDIKSMLGE